jgi:hypothetical protein
VVDITAAYTAGIEADCSFFDVKFLRRDDDVK